MNEFKLTSDERVKLAGVLVEYAHAHLAVNLQKEERGKRDAFERIRAYSLLRIEDIINEGWEQDETATEPD